MRQLRLARRCAIAVPGHYLHLCAPARYAVAVPVLCIGSTAEALFMTISSELEAHIVRLYHVEKWRCGTIARQLKVHRDTVGVVPRYR